MITTINILSPETVQYYNNILLSWPMPKFCDDCESLLKVYNYIVRKLMPKAKRDPLWMQKIEQLEIKFLELYERAKAKEDEFKAKTGESFQKPFSYFDFTNRRNREVFVKIKYWKAHARF